MNCTNLSNVKLSKNLVTLGRQAFEYCSNLSSIEIPKSLENIGTYYYWESYYDRHGVFTGTSLKNVTFEKGITKIPNNLFIDCDSIEDIEIPNTVVTIGSDAFHECSNLTKVFIPSSVTSIGASAFNACSSLSEAIISDSVISIGNYAFYYCTNLQSVNISNSVTELGQYIFGYCNSLKEISIPDSVTSMGSHTFYECTSLEKVKLPNTRKNIVKSMFYNCKSLKEIVLPDTVTNINEYAFEGCSSLEVIVLPESLQNISYNAFCGCKALSEITIPKNVTSIGSSAFQDCDALTKAEIKGSGTIGEKAFYDCDALTSIIISDKVTSIGSNMCYGCDNLTEIKLGKGITTIPDSAFRLCQSLEAVTIPRFCTTIASNAFAENTKLTSAYIPTSVTSIQNNSFSYPNKMTIFGKEGSYANEYADARGFTFNAVNTPVTTLVYPESSIKIGYRATVLPDMQVEPSFDTDIITFTSADTNIATVSASGAVYGKSYGTTTITMTTESGLSDSIEVTVVRPASSVTLNKEGFELAVGNSEVLTATLNPTNSTDIIKWSSDNTDVAVVDETGKITAVGKGTANITAIAVYGNKSATCLVTVVESDVPIVNVTGITLNIAEKEITIGKTSTLKAEVLPQDATNKTIEWSSSNSSVCDVVDGKITAKSLGTATITAKTVSGGFTATCKVTVVPKVEITTFTATSYGANALINLSVVNAPDTAKVYIASFDKLGKMLELQPVVLSNGSTGAIFSTINVFSYKAFVWRENYFSPVSETKEYFLQ